MRNFYLQIFTFRLRPFFLLLIIVLINSCHKDDKQSVTTTNQAEIDLAKVWYDHEYSPLINSLNSIPAKGASNLFCSSGPFNFSQFVKPDWHSALTYIRFDKKVVEVPIQNINALNIVSSPISSGLPKPKNNYSRTSFLILNDGIKYNAFIMVVIADSDYVKNDFTKLAHNTYSKYDKNFSGKVLYFTPLGQFVNGWIYFTGKIITYIPSKLSPTNNTMKPKTTSSLITDDITCTQYYDYIYVNGDFSYAEYSYSICTVDNAMSFAPTDGDAGGGFPPPDGTGGSTTTTVVIDTIVPCNQAKILSQREDDPLLSSKNDSLYNYTQSSQYEFGTSQNLKSMTSNTFVNVPITTQNLTNSFTPTFSWNSSTGYTIGFSHNHPTNSGPDPKDVFPMISFLNDPDLQASGANSIQFYQNNIASTIVTYSGTYVITINNWNDIQNIYNSYLDSPGTFIANFQSIANTYQANNNSTLAEASEFALLKIFGSDINLYSSPAGSIALQPVSINTIFNVIQTGCN